MSRRGRLASHPARGLPNPGVAVQAGGRLVQPEINMSNIQPAPGSAKSSPASPAPAPAPDSKPSQRPGKVPSNEEPELAYERDLPTQDDKAS
jgi:hypothetical protein